MAEITSIIQKVLGSLDYTIIFLSPYLFRLVYKSLPYCFYVPAKVLGRLIQMKHVEIHVIYHPK